MVLNYIYYLADISTTPGWFQEISWNQPGVVARDLLEPPPTLIYGATDYVSDIVYTRDVRFENRHGFMSHNEDVPLIGKQMGEVCVMLFVCIKFMIHEAVEYFNITTPPIIHYTKGGGSNKSLRNNLFRKLMYSGERYMQK